MIPMYFRLLYSPLFKFNCRQISLLHLTTSQSAKWQQLYNPFSSSFSYYYLNSSWEVNEYAWAMMMVLHGRANRKTKSIRRRRDQLSITTWVDWLDHSKMVYGPYSTQFESFISRISLPLAITPFENVLTCGDSRARQANRMFIINAGIVRQQYFTSFREGCEGGWPPCRNEWERKINQSPAESNNGDTHIEIWLTPPSSGRPAFSSSDRTEELVGWLSPDFN